MSLQQHLVTHLQHMYVTERDFQIYLCDMSGKVKDQQLRSALNEEVQGIGTELTNIKKCLDSFGVPVDDSMVSPLVQAFRQEDTSAMQMLTDATPLDFDAHLALTDISFGNSEIGLYQGMLTMAKVLHKNDVVKILEDSLQHEEDDLQKMQRLFNDLINLSEEQKAA